MLIITMMILVAIAIRMNVVISTMINTMSGMMFVGDDDDLTSEAES